MNYLAQEWESYKREVIHPNASDIQINETQKAFYAGAVSFLTIMINENDPDIVQQLNQELINYYEKVQKEAQNVRV